MCETVGCGPDLQDSFFFLLNFPKESTPFICFLVCEKKMFLSALKAGLMNWILFLEACWSQRTENGLMNTGQAEEEGGALMEFRWSSNGALLDL